MRGLTLGDPALLGAAAGFSPASLSPILWLDAADTSTITASSGAVSSWANKGSLGSFGQATAIRQPTTGAATLNGLNILTFSGDFMVSTDAASAYNALHNGTDYIVASVWRVGTTSNPQALYFLIDNAGGSGSRGMWVLYDDISPSNDLVEHSVTRGVAGARAVGNASANALTANAAHVITVLADPDNATAANRSAIYIDGGSAIKNNTLTNAVSTSNASFAMHVGTASNNTGAFPLTGAIAEVIVVTGANATEANRAALHNYLNAKWAVY